jgi:hypothetical protein
MEVSQNCTNRSDIVMWFALQTYSKKYRGKNKDSNTMPPEKKYLSESLLLKKETFVDISRIEGF